METYKAETYHPETFEKREVETKIPIDLVNELKQALDGMENYINTPPIPISEDGSVVFGVMDGSNRDLKYKVLIVPNY